MGGLLVLVGALLIVICVLSAIADLTKVPSVVEVMGRLGLPTSALVPLALIKLAAAVAVFVGFFNVGFAVTAGAALVVYFTGAVIAHARVSDPFRESAAAFVSLVLAMTYVLTALAV